jgi:tRNA/tmRNA/rRNA uracil-C5-methylase (TrmA/RlmC/RlmD family)
VKPFYLSRETVLYLSRETVLPIKPFYLSNATCAATHSFLAMFDSDDPKTAIDVPSFPMGSERINELMPALLAEIKDCEVLRKRLFQVNFLTTVKGDAMISMLYHKRLSEEWEALAEAARGRLGVSIIGRSRKQKVRRGFVLFFSPLTREPQFFFSFFLPLSFGLAAAAA